MTPRCNRCAGELVGVGVGRCEHCQAIEALRELSGIVSTFAQLKLRFRSQLVRANFILRRFDKQYPPLT